MPFTITVSTKSWSTCIYNVSRTVNCIFLTLWSAFIKACRTNYFIFFDIIDNVVDYYVAFLPSAIYFSSNLFIYLTTPNRWICMLSHYLILIVYFSNNERLISHFKSVIHFKVGIFIHIFGLLLSNILFLDIVGVFSIRRLLCLLYGWEVLGILKILSIAGFVLFLTYKLWIIICHFLTLSSILLLHLLLYFGILLCFNNLLLLLLFLVRTICYHLFV